MNKVSVIVAAYNEESTIENCLNSLKKQDYKNLEIIVIDDGSNDKTPKLLKKFDIKTIRTDHIGTARTRNLGAEKATGFILVFLDADMEFAPTFITKLVDPIISGKSKGTFTKLEYVKNWDKPLARCWNRNNANLPDRIRVPQNVDKGEDFRAILKSEFDHVGGFDNVGYTDTWSLAKKLKYKPDVADGAICYHNNPETFKEVFESANWVGKRNYKYGFAGIIINLIRSFVLVSIFKGIVKAVKYKEIIFIPFQIIYDLGISMGTISYSLTQEGKK